MSELATLIEGSDLAGLVRHIDRTVEGSRWDELVELRDRCLEATERGKQVWGAAQFAEYRLALDAPAAYAIDVVRPGAGRFALGPLWEVAASSHTWDELKAIDDPALRALIAHERLLRGDDVDGNFDRTVVDAPLFLADWEPQYAVATYRGDKADFPEVDVLAPASWRELPAAAPPLSDERGPVEALLDLVSPWLESSNGRGEGVAVAGDAFGAIRALGPSRVRVEEIDLSQAMALMAWTGASGGAHGRRRGAPVGRALALWALAVVAGLEEDWPVELEELGDVGEALRWYIWDPADQVGGWRFHLAVTDPVDGLSWAVSAVDAI